jgi:hypothetical protein
MTRVARLLAARPELARHFAERATDPAVSGDMLLKEMRAAGLEATRSAVFKWRQQYRTAKRHRPNALAGRVASTLRTASAEQLASLRLPTGDVTTAVFKLGRKRLYAVASQLGLYPPPSGPRKFGAGGVNDARRMND